MRELFTSSECGLSRRAWVLHRAAATSCITDYGGQLVWSTSLAAHEVLLLLVNSLAVAKKNLRCTCLVCNYDCKWKLSMARTSTDLNAAQVEASDVIC